jgi:hypothetical protein
VEEEERQKAAVVAASVQLAQLEQETREVMDELMSRPREELDEDERLLILGLARLFERIELVKEQEPS